MKRMIFNIIIMIWAFSLIPYVFAQVNIQSSVSKEKITIGDRLDYLVKIQHNKDVMVDYPKIAENLGVFEVKDFNRKKEEKEELVDYEVKYQISTYTLGTYVIPPLKIRYIDSGISAEVFTSAHTVEVISVPKKATDADDIRDITSPLNLQKKEIWKSWVILIVIIIVILFVLYRLFIRKTIIEEEVIEIEIPYNQKIDEWILKLKDSPYNKTEYCKEFYILFSDMIRFYLNKRFHVDTFEKTTGELKIELKKSDIINEKWFDTIVELLEEADFVKFAKMIIESEHYIKSLNKFEEFYRETFVEVETNYSEEEELIEYNGEEVEPNNGPIDNTEMIVEDEK